jgi:glycogen operon protein
VRGGDIKDVMWFNPGGNEMTEEEWNSPFTRCLGMLLSGDAADMIDEQANPVRDDTFFFLINAHYEKIPFMLPGEEHLQWELILDTMEEEGFLHEPKTFSSGDDVDLGGRAACLLKLTRGLQPQARQESWRKRPFGLPEAMSADEERAGGRS